jgi:hypothetical protein
MPDWYYSRMVETNASTGGVAAKAGIDTLSMVEQVRLTTEEL